MHSPRELEKLTHSLLSRQGLLTPFATALEAVEALDGIQAQEGHASDMALQQRVKNYSKADLAVLRKSGRAQRALLQRGTIHLVTASAYERWKLLLSEQAMRKLSEEETKGIERLRRELANSEPLRGAELFRRGETYGFPPNHHRLLTLLPLVRVAGPEGETFGGAEPWRLISIAKGTLEDLAETSVRTYMNAFGPVTFSDFTAWSGLTGARAIFKRLEAKGVIIPISLGEHKYYDLAAPPNESSDAIPKVLVLPDFDNALLGFSNRERIIAPQNMQRMSLNLRSMAPILLQGQVEGVWRPRISSAREQVAVTIETYRTFSKSEKAETERQLLELYTMWRPEWTTTITWLS